jgi:hypothetical protein
MIWNPKRRCVTNDDGTLIVPNAVTRPDGSVGFSIQGWSDRKYIGWLQDAVHNSGRQTRDNTHLWDNKIKYCTSWGK